MYNYIYKPCKVIYHAIIFQKFSLKSCFEILSKVWVFYENKSKYFILTTKLIDKK